MTKGNTVFLIGICSLQNVDHSEVLTVYEQLGSYQSRLAFVDSWKDSGPVGELPGSKPE